jgi:hypothetical protein
LGQRRGSLESHVRGKVNRVQAAVTGTDLVWRDERAIANALKIRYTPFAVDGGEGGCLFDVDVCS